MRVNLLPARTNNSRREPKIKIGVGEDQGKCSAMKTIWQHLQKRSPDHDAGQDKRNADQAHYQALRFEFEINFEFDIVIGISWFRRPPLLLFVIVILEQHVILKYPYFA